MELRQLQYFKAVADVGSISKAAADLYISQPSLSACIKRLETDLGIELFSRKGRTIQLTSPGRIFLEYVNKALHELEKGKEKAAEIAGKENATISFSTNIQNPFDNIALGYQRKNPNVSIHSRFETIEKIKKQLLDYEIDLALTDIPAKEADFSWRPVMQCGVMLLVHKDNRLAKKQSVSVRDLETARFVSFESGITNMTYQICHSAGFEPDFYHIGTNPIMRKAFFENNMTVSFIPDRIAEGRPKDDTVVIPLTDCDQTYTIGILSRADYVPDALSADFCRYLQTKEAIRDCLELHSA